MNLVIKNTRPRAVINGTELLKIKTIVKIEFEKLT